MKHKLLFKDYLKTFMLLAFFAFGQVGFGQTIFSENIGTSTAGTTAISANTFENNPTLSYVGDADTRTTTASSGYSGSSGGRNVFLTNTVGKYFTIYNINSSGFENLVLSLGILKSTANTVTMTSSQFVVEVATDYNSTNNTGTFTQLSFSNISTGATTWSLITCTGIIQASSTLAIRFRQNNTISQVRIDDIKLTGTAIVQTPITWNGITNNNFSVATNWTPNTVPTSNDDVVISSGTPVLNQAFTIGTGKTLTVSGSGSLTVNPGITLTIAGTADFGGKSITLKSDASGTGSIGQVTGTVTGATNVTVERYITGRRAFRFLTPSVTTTTSIKANWQNGGATTPGIGTHITGSTTGANGFDQTISGNTSLATYNAQVVSGTGFVNATNTDMATLKAGVGYRILVRGDRTLDLSLPSTDNMNVATTLSANGTLTTGAVTFDASSGTSPVLINNQSGNTQTNGYTLIGNPYASPVDWHAVTKTGVANNAYYTWDPTLGTAAQRGRYVVYTVDGNGVGSTNVLLPSDGTLVTSNRQFLQTGQAVFIKNADLAVPATLTFNEANKVATNSYVFRSNEQAVTTTGNASLFLTVYDPNELAIAAAPIDGALALFGAAYSNALDANDVDKLSSSGENVAFVRENKNLAIETLAPVATDDVLFVKTVQFQANKNYTFKVNTANFDTAVSAKMVDLYLNTETAIDLTQPSFVSFATTSDVNSYGADRFKIVFSSTALANENFTKNTIAIYPNPIANNQFTIALPSSVSGNVTVRMNNMLGQEVYNRTMEATSTMQIQPKQQLEEGVYVVSINNKGQVIQAKVIVKK